MRAISLHHVNVLVTAVPVRLKNDPVPIGRPFRVRIIPVGEALYVRAVVVQDVDTVLGGILRLSGAAVPIGAKENLPAIAPPRWRPVSLPLADCMGQLAHPLAQGDSAFLGS